MLNKYVILVTLVVNSLSDNHGNEVEPANSELLKYGEQKCSKLTVENGAVEPDGEIGIYETYTVDCNTNYHMELGEKAIVGIDPVYTCIPGEASAALSPETPPTCINTEWVQETSAFSGQVDANADSKYAVEKSQIGCWTRGRNDFDGGDNLGDCPNRQWVTYIDIGCNADHGDSIFVGYNSLRVFDETEEALWGKDIIDDPLPKLKIYMACIPPDQKATVCMKVDQVPAVSNTKLSVKVYSVPISSGDTSRQQRSMNIKQSDDIHYRLRCDDGYSFEEGIKDDTVYGYCTKAGTGEEEGDNEFFAYTTASAEDAINCYSKCPANPENANTFNEGSTPVFGKLYLPSMRKGATFTVVKKGVECSEGHALAEGAPENYEIKCEGADTTAEANSGLLSCTDCPVCYAKCPANPDSPDKFVSEEGPVFKQLEITELIKGEQVSLAPEKVTCEDGHSLAEGAPESYTITCSDAGEGDPNLGLLSCGEQCPKCYAMCPENPNSEKFAAGTDIVFNQLTMPALKKGASHTLSKDNVNCAENMGVAADAPVTFEITCGEANADQSSGLFSCTTCPKCFAQCLANPTGEKLVIPEESGVKSVKIAANMDLRGSIDVSRDDIECKDSYAMAGDAPATYTFRCGENGMLTCAGGQNGCPKCQGTCTWPEATAGDDGYDFQYVDETKRGEDRAEHAIPGVNHVEAYCTNKSLVIVGPRFLSCVTDNAMVFDTTGYTEETKPQCQAEPVCEAPATVGGSLQKTGNIPVGEVYTLTCSEGYMFDLETQEEHDSAEAVIEITCVKPAADDTLVNTDLPELACYSGCKQTEAFNGTITPPVKRSGGAPYSEGQVVTFTCNHDYELHESSEGTQTCTNGKIGSGVAPKCTKKVTPTEDTKGGSADRSAASSLLAVSLLTVLLWS